MEDKLQAKERKKRRHRLPIHVYLSYLLACTMLATGVTFSNYVTGASCTPSTARVAAGAVRVTKTSAGSLEIDCRNKENDSATYTFTVSNSDRGKTSEVALGYDVIVELDEALPDGVDLTLGNKQAKITDSEKTYIFYNVGTFGANTSDSRKHTLTFSANSNDLFDEAEIDVTISVRTYQID